MQARISRFGNSCGVRIPKSMLSSLGLQEKDVIEISFRGNEIVIKKSLPQTPEEFWAGAKAEDYEPVEIHWGDNVGTEAIYW